MKIVTGWLRRSYLADGTNGYACDPGAYEQAKTIIRLWNQTFPEFSYRDFRKFLTEVASSQNAISLVRDWKETQAEWVIPIDDDDWILAGIEQALANVPEEFVLVGWSVQVANLLQEPGLFIEKVHWQTGPHSCGYAMRKWWLETLTQRQLALIRDDHRHVHRYVDFAGRKYLFFENRCLAQYVWTPASVSSIKSPEATRLSFATAEKYHRFAEQCESQGYAAVARIARKLAELAHKKLRENVPFSVFIEA